MHDFASASRPASGLQWERALELLGLMQESGLEVNAVTCSAAISACDGSQKWQQALRVWGLMADEGLARDGPSYGAVVGALREGSRRRPGAERWRAAVEVMREVRASGKALAHPSEGSIYGAAVDACMGEERWERALHLLKAVRQQRLALDDVSHGSAMRAQEQASRWSRTLQLLEDRATKSSPRVCSCRPSRVYQTQVLQVLDNGVAFAGSSYAVSFPLNLDEPRSADVVSNRTGQLSTLQVSTRSCFQTISRGHSEGTLRPLYSNRLWPKSSLHVSSRQTGLKITDDGISGQS